MTRWLTLALAVSMTVAASAQTVSAVDGAIEYAKALMLPDPGRAVLEARRGTIEARRLPASTNRQRLMATTAWLEAEALYRIGHADEAMIPLARARSLASSVSGEELLKGDILLTGGSIDGARGDVTAALSDYLASHHLFVSAGNQRKQAMSLICLAILFSDANDYDASLHYLNEALEAYPADAQIGYAIYNSRAIVFQSKHDYRRADVDFHHALTLARQVNNLEGVGKFLRNIARNQLLAGKMREAERSIAIARRTPPPTGTPAQRQLDGVSAQAALQAGRTAEAKLLIERAFAGVDLATTDLSFRDAHQTAVAIYRTLRLPGRALTHLDALKRLDDKATKLATETGTALMAARFDSANQEAKIARLRDAERLRQAREALQRARVERIFWLGGAGATATIIALLLAGVIALRRSRDRVRAANADLAVTNTALGKALAAKTEFLATTSHEIRTPLNGILGMTQVMLADAALSVPTRERLGVVQGAGLTMRALVDDILDVAKMETGHLTLEHAPFDLAACVRDAGRLWAEQAEAKGLRFVIDLDRCPPWVDGDAARLRQLAFNLLSNAVKFTAAGSITLTAEVVGDGVRLSVADTGIGIAADKREAVFESFRQADTSTTRRFGGTGLGLAIVRSLARAMGGDVTLRSTPGVGTTFVVDLPLPTVAAPVGSAPDGGETLLIVERNPIARAMLRALLQPHVATIAFAGTLAQAAACFESGTVIKVLVDDATARASGDATAFLRDLAAITDARISLLWPIAVRSEEAELLATGINRVIAKPVTGAALVAALFGHEPNVDQRLTLVSQAA